MVAFLIIFGAVPAGTKNSFQLIMTSFFATAGIAFFIIATISNKSTHTISNTIVTSRLIAPMADDHLIPGWFSKKNKNGEYAIAMCFDAGAKIGEINLNVSEKILFTLGMIMMIFAIIVQTVPPIVGDPYGITIESTNSYIVKIIQWGVYILGIGVRYILFWLNKRNKKQLNK